MSLPSSFTILCLVALIHITVSFIPPLLPLSYQTLVPLHRSCFSSLSSLLFEKNDPTNPDLDEQGYTLYTDPETNTTGRVFEKLVDYPSVFTIKVVGENTPTFTPDMIDLVNEVSACNVHCSNVIIIVSGIYCVCGCVYVCVPVISFLRRLAPCSPPHNTLFIHSISSRFAPSNEPFTPYSSTTARRRSEEVDEDKRKVGVCYARSAGGGEP